MTPFQIETIKPAINAIHKKYGDRNFAMLYGTGCTTRPHVLFLFMNPTGRNLSTQKTWKGLRASWVGHKNTWKFFCDLGLFSAVLNKKIQTMKTNDWTPAFVEEIYADIAQHKVYITGLGRCVQPDARYLPDVVFRDSRAVTLQEIEIINPRVVIAFGNQVASNLLEQPIKVSESRCKKYDLVIGKKKYPVYPTFYPVGMGFRNIGKAIEDIKSILQI